MAGTEIVNFEFFGRVPAELIPYRVTRWCIIAEPSEIVNFDLGRYTCSTDDVQQDAIRVRRTESVVSLYVRSLNHT